MTANRGAKREPTPLLLLLVSMLSLGLLLSEGASTFAAAAEDGGTQIRGPRLVPPPDPFAAPDVHLSAPKLSRRGPTIDVAVPVRFVRSDSRSTYEVRVTVHERLSHSGAARGLKKQIMRTGVVTGSRKKLHVRLNATLTRHLKARGLTLPLKPRTHRRDPARLIQVLVRQTISGTDGEPLRTMSAGASAHTGRPPKLPDKGARAMGARSDGGGRRAAAVGGNNIIQTGDDPTNPRLPGQDIPVKVTVSSGTGDELVVTTFPVACMKDEATTGLTTTFQSASDSASGTATVVGGQPYDTATLGLGGLADSYNRWLATEGEGANNLAVLGGVSPSISQFYGDKPVPFGTEGQALVEVLDQPGMEITPPHSGSDPAATLTNGAACGVAFAGNPQLGDWPIDYDGAVSWYGDYSGGSWSGYYTYVYASPAPDDPPSTVVDPAYFFIQVTDIEPTSAAGTSFLSGLVAIQPVNQWYLADEGEYGFHKRYNLYQPKIYAQFIPIAASNPGGGGSYACATVTIPGSLNNGAVGVGIQFNLDSGDPTTETTDAAGSTCQP